MGIILHNMLGIMSVHLRPSAQLVTEIVQVKSLKVGETVSYGRTLQLIKK